MPKFSVFDRFAMRRALLLARRGLYSTRPNPRVGCVLALDDRIIAEGYHQIKGGMHAETAALSQVPPAVDMRQVTVYVTLEPCAHQGATPPCAAELVNRRVKRVVAAIKDPNPLVSGKGFALLKEHNITVECGLSAKEAQELNRGFISRMSRCRPFSLLKTALSLDGKIALNNGQSQWLTSPASRLDVQKLRAASGAILTGIGTVLKDNPRLNVRDIDIPGQPVRIVLDSALKIPKDTYLLQDTSAPTWIITLITEPQSLNKFNIFPHVRIINGQAKNGRIDLPALWRQLASLEINDLLIECGPTLAGALWQEDLIDELCCYTAPVILGDKAQSAFTLPQLTDLSQARRWQLRQHTKIGTDIKLILTPQQQ